MVGHFGVLVRDRDLMDYREKLWRYVENGGVCYWAYQYAWGWKPGDDSGPGYFPAHAHGRRGHLGALGRGHRSGLPGNYGRRPHLEYANRITPEDWLGWKVGPPDRDKMLHYNTLPNTDRARNIPVYYSDRWQAHATALKPTLSTRRASVNVSGLTDGLRCSMNPRRITFPSCV